MSTNINFTVSICTYNRADSLKRTLESFCAAEKPGVPWELLIIDNNSKDGTPAIVKQFEERLPLRYIFEGVQGPSAARNRAVDEFCGNTLLFTDDDVRIDAGWLRAYEQAVRMFRRPAISADASFRSGAALDRGGCASRVCPPSTAFLYGSITV